MSEYSLSERLLSSSGRGGRFASRVLPALVYLVAILVGGSLPSGGGSGGMSDKTLHFLVFSLFAVLVVRALVFYYPTKSLSARLVQAIGWASLVGGLLEVWQFCLPHRSCEFLDWVADTAGAVVGCAIVGVVTLLRRPRADGRDAGPFGEQTEG